ncbi:DUF922 domain-containing protein [Maribacter sp. 4U21]|nr:DUF922 domain-containing protein [Maribacter sp. 4U21]
MGVIKNAFLIFFFFVMFSSYSWGQEEVLWEPDKRLYWSDFRGKVPVGAGAAATTASGISYQFSTSYKGNEMVVDYEVNAFFYPTKSWYKPNICNEATLVHEQLHFDISELFARHMRKKMAKARFTKNIKAEVKAIYRETLKELNDFQNRYDKETDYSRNIPQQKFWIQRIEKALNEG